MAIATVAFSLEHDIAAISWPRRPNDFPCPAINKALDALYRDDAGAGGTGDLAPKHYQVYRDDGTCIGMLVAHGINPKDDRDIRQIFDDIMSKDQIAPKTDGPFARFTIEV